MKTITHISRNLTLGFAVLTIASLALLPALTSAQEQVKGAQKLIQLNASKTVADAKAVPANQTAAMSCSQCQDSTVTITERPTKTGAKPNSYTVARHECPGCKNTVATSGHGKAAVQTVTHTCSLSGTEGAACCAKR